MMILIVPIFWPAIVITILIIRLIIKKPYEKERSKWTNNLYYLVPILANLLIFLFTWEPMFDDQTRGNGSGLVAALIIYCILLTIFLLVTWRTASEMKFSGKVAKSVLIILILTQFFPVIREDFATIKRNFDSGAIFGISKEEAKKCAISKMGTERRYTLEDSRKDGSEWEFTYKLYGENGKEYLDQETYFVNARSCKAEKLTKGELSEVSIKLNGKRVEGAEILLVIYDATDATDITTRNFWGPYDYQVTNSQGEANIITTVDSNYFIPTKTPSFYLTIINNGQLFHYKLPSQFLATHAVDISQ